MIARKSCLAGTVLDRSPIEVRALVATLLDALLDRHLDHLEVQHHLLRVAAETAGVGLHRYGAYMPELGAEQLQAVAARQADGLALGRARLPPPHVALQSTGEVHRIPVVVVAWACPTLLVAGFRGGLPATVLVVCLRATLWATVAATDLGAGPLHGQPLPLGERQLHLALAGAPSLDKTAMWRRPKAGAAPCEPKGGRAEQRPLRGELGAARSAPRPHQEKLSKL